MSFLQHAAPAWRSHARRKSLLMFPFVLLAAACGANLAGEPGVVATLPPRPTALPTAADLGYPLAAPDLLLGAQIFAENCAACHGGEGRGDGPLWESGQLPVQPANFTDPATARGQTPAELFATITQGRIESLMPPWGNALSEEERWAVALYTYTLAYEPEEAARGARLYAENCAECHGEGGRGDGPRTAEINRPVPDLTEQSELVALSDEALFGFISEGIGDTMPAFAATLADAERRAVAAYVRVLPLESRAIITSRARGEPLATEEPRAPEATPAPATESALAVTPAGESSAFSGLFGTPPAPGAAAEAPPEAPRPAEAAVTIRGAVTNGTAGGAVPPELTARLHSFDAEFNESTVEIDVAADGGFAIDDVAVDPLRQYFVSVVYRDRLFTSELVDGSTIDGEADLPVTIYELTEDPEAITIDGMVTQISGFSEGLQVAQVLTFNNHSDRLFTSSSEIGPNRFASVQVELPPGAVVLGFPGAPQRYVTLDEERFVLDTLPVLPGEDHIFQVTYFLPYEDGAIIEQPLHYALTGPVRLLLQPATLVATSEQLEFIGQQTIRTTTYQEYGNTLALAAADVIRFELNGAVAAVSVSGEATTPGGASSGTLIPAAIIAVGAGLLLTAAVLYVRGERRRRVAAPAADGGARIDALVAQLAELDEQHEAGDINHDLYHRRRGALKTELAELMGETTAKD